MYFISFKSPLCSSLQCLENKHIIYKMREKTVFLYQVWLAFFHSGILYEQHLVELILMQLNFS